jgi:hypothetical protein
MIYLNLQTGLCLNGGKMYKRLIDEKWESYNDAGLRFANEINAIVEPVIDKFIAEGYSIFDMDKIAYDQIALMMIYKLADRNINKRIEENGN